MRRNIRHYSPKKHFGKATKRRRAINFEKQNPYSLDARIVERKVKKSMQFFREFRNEKAPMENNKIIMQFFRVKIYIVAILGTLSEILARFDKWSLYSDKKFVSAYLVSNVLTTNSYYSTGRQS